MILRKIQRVLKRLWPSTSANVLPYVCFAMIPLMVLIGSSVDISRAYMVKTKLQSACDASSLAARRVMRNDDLNSTVEATGRQFFTFNFPTRAFQTETFTPTFTKPESGVVRVDARTRMRTSIMSIFGYNWIPVSVTCDASLNFVNTDVMLVLDVTGSMAETVGGVSKIVSLRSAVMALFDELAPIQTQLETQGLRLRYGIVPYSSTVNVGRLLFALDRTYLTTSTTYPSRVANYNTALNVANTPTSSGAWEYYNGNATTGSNSPTTSTRSNSQCQTWVAGTAVNGGGPAPTATTQTTYGGTSTSTAYNASQNWGWTGATTTTGTNRSCRRWKTITTTTYTPRRQFTNWTYRQVAYDTTQFIQPTGSMLIATTAGGNVAAPGGSYNAQQLAAAATGVSTSSVTWNGCIEERDTTTSIDGGTSLTIPSSAFDLDINRIPDSNETRWHPQLAQVEYTRTAGSGSVNSNNASNDTTGWLMNIAASNGYYACPTEARRLDVWTRDQMSTYVNSLVTIGGTYHDIGMIWGARMISTEGVFSDGCEEYNGMPCNRHIIFMTDGAQTAYCDVLTAYGIEQNDLRVTGGGSCPSQLSRHQQRFRMICNAAKNMNVSVWVVGFDTALNTNLTGCASNSSQASTSANQAALIAKFREIGNQIGALRLVK